MGDHEGWAQPSGLLPNEAATVMRVLDMDRWSKAEERTTELIACIQPNESSEERRIAVADYVRQLIMKCFSCQVFTFGSVPLKTYLPDGDIDLTAFSKSQNLKDTWAQDVRDMLEIEEKSANAEFRVKEVQYIQAEVKIVKCLVENIVVDISFDQLGGLCTLCFLDEVDYLINHNHLFKRSIILIKAWCYYESRILGAHHGLISTYALETLVLYIFHVFNNSFAGPLEVLFRFLEFFSSFDWDNFCVSLSGPVRISSLPEMTAEPPRNDSGELLLSKIFLDACSSVYGVFPQENHSQPFVSKHFNVIDPLRTNNNLGRSVSKGNFFRIRSAFAFGARKLARVLECPKENMIAELNQFFMNTLERHGSGIRPDAPLPEQWPPRPISESENFRHQYGLKKKGESRSPEFQAEGLVSFQGKPLQTVENASHSSERMTRATTTTAFSRTQSHKVHINQKNSNDLDQFTRSNEASQVEKNKLVNSSSHISGEQEYYGKHFFGRTRSSPELTDTATEGYSRGTSNQFLGSGKNHYISASSRRRNAISNEVPTASHRTRPSHNEHSALLPNLSNQSLETVVDLTNVSNSHHKDAVVPVDAEGLASETMDAHQEEQDFVNMMASPRVFNFDGQAQFPFNLVSHLPLPLSHSVLASMGYSQRNLPGVVPANVPLVDPSWLPNGQPFPRGVTSSPVLHYIPSSGLTSNSEETFESGDESSGLVNAIQEDNDGVWLDQEGGPTRHVNYENGNVQMVQTDEKQQPPAAFSYTSSHGNNFGSSHISGEQNFGKESEGQIRDDSGDSLQPQSSHENDSYSSDRSSSMRYMPGLQTGSSRSKPSSESSWDGSSTRNSKAVRDKRGRKTSASSAPSTSYGKVKGALHREGPSSDRASSHTDDNRDWIPISTMSTETVERNSEPSSVVPSHLPSHQIAVYDNTQISGSDSVIPITPVLVNSNSAQRSMDGSGLVPIAFYPTIFFPIYNFHTETGQAESLASESDRDDTIDSSSRISQSVENLDPVESLDQFEMFASSSVKSFPEEIIEAHHKPDILNSDFASHWQNLQYGRLCQNTRHPGSLIYPPHVMLPQMYFPWEGPGRPISATNANQFAQIGYGHRLVPVSLQSGSSRPPAGGFQRYGDEPPRYRGGTGTYLPNPKVAYRERQSSHARSYRGNYHFERNDRGEREGSWNVGSKTRPPGRSHGRNHTEKQNLRAERSVASDMRNNRQWEPHKLDQSFNSYQVQTGPFSSTSSVHVPASAAYAMYGMPSVSTNGVTSTGPAVPNVPPVVMLYPYDPSVGGYGHQLEFGSLGPVRFSGGDEGSQLADPTRAAYGRRRGTYPGGSSACSSPDKPSTPQQVQRSATQRNYQLKEEDFPPLLFPNNGGENVSKRTTGHVSKPNHFQTFYYS